MKTENSVCAYPQSLTMGNAVIVAMRIAITFSSPYTCHSKWIGIQKQNKPNEKVLEQRRYFPLGNDRPTHFAVINTVEYNSRRLLRLEMEKWRVDISARL